MVAPGMMDTLLVPLEEHELQVYFLTSLPKLGYKSVILQSLPKIGHQGIKLSKND